jgi:hypothetical protein
MWIEVSSFSLQGIPTHQLGLDARKILEIDSVDGIPLIVPRNGRAGLSFYEPNPMLTKANSSRATDLHK